jgi:hypothetical protein
MPGASLIALRHVTRLTRGGRRVAYRSVWYVRLQAFLRSWLPDPLARRGAL